MKSGRTLIICLIVGVVVGVIFVFLPTQNTPTNWKPNCNAATSVCSGLCTGASNYTIGIKKNGFPITNKTVYTGECVAGDFNVDKSKAVSDFLIGLFIGAFLTLLIINRMLEKK